MKGTITFDRIESPKLGTCSVPNVRSQDNRTSQLKAGNYFRMAENCCLPVLDTETAYVLYFVSKTVNSENWTPCLSSNVYTY